MKTRKVETPKSAPPKKSPPVKKTAGKTTSAPPESSETKRVLVSKPKQLKSVAEASVSKPEPAEANTTGDAAQATLDTKVVSTKPAVKRVPIKTKSPVAAKPVSTKKEVSADANLEDSPKVSNEPADVDVAKSTDIEKSNVTMHEADAESLDDKDDPNTERVDIEEDTNEIVEGEEEDEPEEDEDNGYEEVPEDSENKIVSEGTEEKHGEQVDATEAEHTELTANARERKIKREREVFIGGLERNADESDVRKAFEHIGEIVEVRLNKNPSTNKNMGYAFVKFATKEQATRALSEIKHPIIRGKRCGTAPSEDNTTLFVGNICNTWTKEAIKQKMMDYGVRGVEYITLVADAQHEGLSRGFAFVEFSSHGDAMIAFRRLQKPDAILGHAERTAKVAFAEPLREPDPQVMAQVKSVFIDGLPSHWDEDRVREHFKGYGEIEKVTLARNMSTARRKDFGFVDFTTHEAAVACIDGITDTELGEGNSKTKVKARLSNPLPKTQAVKGGICGGFQIGYGGTSDGGNFSKNGRDLGRSSHSFNRSNIQRGRDFVQGGRGQIGRAGFSREYGHESASSEFHERRNFGQGGRRGSFRSSGAGAAPMRSNLDRQRHGAADRAHGPRNFSRRQPYSPEGGVSRPFSRHFDDSYGYDDIPRGMKRPLFLTDEDTGYLEPSRRRARLDYSDHEIPLRGSRYQDTYGSGSGIYSGDYYGSDYGEGSYSSLYGRDHPYGGGYYY